MKTTYALLIGINDYPPPVPKLSGCLRDIDRVETYLRTYVGQGEEEMVQNTEDLNIRSYGSLQLCRLENEQATYHNMIHAFRHFLRQAGPQDVAWFHFSGHGSEEFTADDFLAIEPNGKDQTLVCYWETEANGHLHLADKELAVLLHEVATLDMEGQPKQTPHLVVSLDCCHSGSATRDIADQVKIRGFDLPQPAFANERIKARKVGIKGRSLDTYVNGYYTQQWKAQQKLEVPSAKHVLLSACESIQKAGEVSEGGIFTTGLIEALTKAKGQLNYADLFVRTRATARRIRQAQTPQFEVIGNFDPYTRFIEGSALGSPDRYTVILEREDWFVKCGAIHGLPIKHQQPIELEIQTAAPENRPIAKGQITGVGAQKSQFMLLAGESLEKGHDYQAIIRFLPAPPVLVWLHGDVAGIERLKKRWDVSKNIRWVDEPEDTYLEVEATGAQFLLREQEGKQLVFTLPQEEDSIPLIIDTLDKIVRWKRTITLDNARSGLRDIVDLELGIMGKNRQWITYNAPETLLKISPDNGFEGGGGIGLFFSPKLIVRDTSQVYYGYLLHLRFNYSIESYEGEIVFRPVEHPGKEEVLLPMWKRDWGWGLSANEQSATSYFKLLVTRQPLDYQQLLQAGIGEKTRGTISWSKLAVKDDWCSFTIKVILERND